MKIKKNKNEHIYIYIYILLYYYIIYIIRIYIKGILILKRLKNLIKHSMKLTGMKSKVANIHPNLMKHF